MRSVRRWAREDCADAVVSCGKLPPCCGLDGGGFRI
jgi:hypothetical protein